MDTQQVRYYAYFADPHAVEGDDDLDVLVESWDADGRALILDQEEGRLVAAKDQPGFLRVERYEEPRLRGVLPGGNWKLRMKNDQSRIGHDVVAFLVYDTYVRPVSNLPSAGSAGNWQVNASNHSIYQPPSE